MHRSDLFVTTQVKTLEEVDALRQHPKRDEKPNVPRGARSLKETTRESSGTEPDQGSARL
jgi:hypothetical protein